MLEGFAPAPRPSRDALRTSRSRLRESPLGKTGSPLAQCTALVAQRAARRKPSGSRSRGRPSLHAVCSSLSGISGSLLGITGERRAGRPSPLRRRGAHCSAKDGLLREAWIPTRAMHVPLAAARTASRGQGMARGGVDVASRGQGMARGGADIASNGQGIARDGPCVASPARGCLSSALDGCLDALRVAEGAFLRAESGQGVGLIGPWRSRAAISRPILALGFGAR
jgi:hypothetical protein